MRPADRAQQDAALALEEGGRHGAAGVVQKGVGRDFLVPVEDFRLPRDE